MGRRKNDSPDEPRPGSRSRPTVPAVRVPQRDRVPDPAHCRSRSAPHPATRRAVDRSGDHVPGARGPSELYVHSIRTLPSCQGARRSDRAVSSGQEIAPDTGTIRSYVLLHHSVNGCPVVTGLRVGAWEAQTAPWSGRLHEGNPAWERAGRCGQSGSAIVPVDA